MKITFSLPQISELSSGYHTLKICYHSNSVPENIAHAPRPKLLLRVEVAAEFTRVLDTKIPEHGPQREQIP